MTSRVARKPIVLASGITVDLKDNEISVKGSKGQLTHTIPACIDVATNDNKLVITAKDDERTSNALAGTTRAILNNMVVGVSAGFERKLILKGVGYRAQVKGSILNLTLGFSHPVDFEIPQGIEIETPSQTEIVIRGIEKQKVGQVAANIRAYRPPEPYKGKGIRYADEVIQLKETKKK